MYHPNGTFIVPGAAVFPDPGRMEAYAAATRGSGIARLEVQQSQIVFSACVRGRQTTLLSQRLCAR